MMLYKLFSLSLSLVPEYWVKFTLFICCYDDVPFLQNPAVVLQQYIIIYFLKHQSQIRK